MYDKRVFLPTSMSNFFVLVTDIAILPMMAGNFRIKTMAKHLHIVMQSCWKFNVLIWTIQYYGFFIP